MIKASTSKLYHNNYFGDQHSNIVKKNHWLSEGRNTQIYYIEFYYFVNLHNYFLNYAAYTTSSHNNELHASVDSNTENVIVTNPHIMTLQPFAK